jgi:hypothetical protein
MIDNVDEVAPRYLHGTLVLQTAFFVSAQNDDTTYLYVVATVVNGLTHVVHLVASRPSEQLNGLTCPTQLNETQQARKAGQKLGKGVD